jgi:uncharacterized protein YidB (DUF937 family)
MSLFGGILGNVVGSVFGSNPRGSQQNMLGEVLANVGGNTPFESGQLLHAALKLVQQNGGLEGLLSRMRAGGLAEQADSWVGKGPNLPITPEQLQQAVGPQALDEVAAPLHLSAAEAGDSLSQILPELVNQLTPAGTVPADHAALLTKAMSILSSAGA